MSKKLANVPSTLEINCERGLRIGAIIVAINTLFLSIYRFYDLNNCITFRNINYTLFSLLVLAAISYFFLCKVHFPHSFQRIKSGIRSVFCKEFLLLFLLLTWYFISCIAVGDHYNGDWLQANRQYLFDTAISILILFPLSFILPRHRMKTVFHAMIHLFVGIMTVLMIIVLWAVFQNRWLEIPGGAIGMNEQIRLVINSHPNTGGAYASIFIMLCVYMMITQHPILKILYAIAFFVHTVILILTNSRTCFVAVALCVTLSALVYLWHFTNKKAMKLRVCACLAAAVLIVFSLTGLRSAVFDIFESTTHFSEILAQQKDASQSSDTASSDDSNSEREMSLSSSEMRGRYDLWLYAIKSMTSDSHKALYGVTPVSVISALKLAGDGKYDNFDYYTHNQFLEVGVALGWPGFFLFFFFMVLVARNCLKIGLSRDQYPFKGFYVIPITILLLVISNLTEAILLFYHFLSGSIFFLLCGWVTLESRDLPDPPFLKLKAAKTIKLKKRNK